MATTSFQITIYDYLRIFFHRALWIGGLFAISIAAAFFWLEWVAVPQYRSDMVVMVWARDLEAPLLRRMVQDIPLHRLIAAIRDKLQVDNRLQDLAANLRFRLKQRIWEGEMAEKPAAAGAADEKYLHSILASLAAGHECVLQPHGLLVSRFWWLREDVRLGLTEFVANIDTPSLAWTLGAAREAEDGIILNGEDDPIYLGGLRRLLLPEASQASAAEVRRRAEEELLRRLQAECAKAGAGNFDERARREIIKEFVALTPLLEIDLYDIVGAQYHRPSDISPWISHLKSGLSVSAGRSNLITFRCEIALYRRRPPFDKRANVVVDDILRIAYEMMKGEFQSVEAARWENAFSTIAKQIEAAQREIEEVNKELYDYDNLANLQMAFVDTPPMETHMPTESLPRYWSDAFLGLRQHSVHIRRMDEIRREIDQITNLDLPELTARLRAIQQQIADPSNQRIRVEARRPIERGAPPEVRDLQRQRQAKSLELNRLLRNNTERHPMVQKTLREIEEIDAQIRAYTPRTTSVESEVEEQINPQLAEWRKEEREIKEKISQKEEHRKHLRQLFEMEHAKAKEAIEKQQKYQTLLDRQRLLQGQLADLQRQSQDLQSKRLAREEMAVEMEIHTHPRKPARPFAPQAMVVYLVALFIGLLAAVSVVFTLEYTDHSIKSPQDIKRHLQLPVLGTIPDFAFAGREHEEQILERWRRSLLGRPHAYPTAVDIAEPPPLAERRRTATQRRMTRIIAPVAAVLAIMLGIYAYPKLSGYASAAWQKILQAIGKTEASAAPAAPSPGDRR